MLKCELEGQIKFNVIYKASFKFRYISTNPVYFIYILPNVYYNFYINSYPCGVLSKSFAITIFYS